MVANLPTVNWKLAMDIGHHAAQSNRQILFVVEEVTRQAENQQKLALLT